MRRHGPNRNTASDAMKRGKDVGVETQTEERKALDLREADHALEALGQPLTWETGRVRDTLPVITNPYPCHRLPLAGSFPFPLRSVGDVSPAELITRAERAVRNLCYGNSCPNTHSLRSK